MGLISGYFTEGVETAGDVAVAFRRLSEKIKNLPSVTDARLAVVQFVTRPDVREVLGDNRIAWMRRDLQGATDVESVAVFLTNSARILEKEDQAQSDTDSWKDVAKNLAGLEMDMQVSHGPIVGKKKKRKGLEVAKQAAKDIVKELPDAVKLKEKNAEDPLAERWRGMTPRERYAIARKAGFSHEDAKGLSRLAWEGLNTSIKQDLEWVLRDRPEELPEQSDVSALWDGMNFEERFETALKANFHVGDAFSLAHLRWKDINSSDQRKLERQMRAVGILGEGVEYFCVNGKKVRVGTRVRLRPGFGLRAPIEATIIDIGMEDCDPVVDYETDDGEKGWAYLDQIEDVLSTNEHFLAPMVPMGVATVGGASYHGPSDGEEKLDEVEWFDWAKKKISYTAPELRAQAIEYLVKDYQHRIKGYKSPEVVREELLEFAVSIRQEAFPGQLPMTGVVEGIYKADWDKMTKWDRIDVLYATFVISPKRVKELVNLSWEELPDDVRKNLEQYGKRGQKEGDQADPVSRRPPFLTPGKKRAINRRLSEISKKLWNSMWEATAAIHDALGSEGVDVEEYMITGEPSGRRTLNLLMGDEEVANAMLVLSWHRFEETGRYEVNAYVS
jgi:hypothetical protein